MQGLDKSTASRRLRWCVVISICLFSLRVQSQTPEPVTLEANGWTIGYSPSGASLTISAKNLGIVARDLQLNEETPSGLRRLAHFSAHINTGQRLIIETAAPKTTWVFDALPGKVAISSTGFRGVVTGWAASPANRTIGILLDPEGKAVKWEGTDEAVGTYGGSRTSEPSYLPRRHPEVMHMGLGHVAGAGMHSLFDRRTDTAIDFGEDAVLVADAGTKDAYALTIPVRDSATIQLTPDYYTRVLRVPFYVPYDDTYSPTAPIVWSSWTSYYAAVTEQDIVRNADWLAKNLKPYGFKYVVLDDGYDRPADFDRPELGSHGPPPQSVGHSWIRNWSKDRFPHGPEWLTSYIHAQGLKAGLWLVPNAYGPALNPHPDWYLYDKQGNVLRDYGTPALDSTNPHVLEFLRYLFTKLDGMGFDYYKFDGESALPAYAPPVDKSRMYSPNANSIESFRKRFRVIRQTLGPQRFIEECPAGTPLNAIGFVNSYFNGNDLYNNWHGMYSLFSSITGNLFLNHLAVYVMPGEGLELGEPMTVAEAAVKRPSVVLEVAKQRDSHLAGFGVTLAEARTLVTYVSLTGVVYPLASVMPELPAERVKLLEVTMPTLPILPIDLFSRGTDTASYTFKHVQADAYIHHFPEVLDLKVNSAAGVYDVAAETNWSGETTARSLDFSQLGLPLDRSYIIFDFWKQQPLGIYKNKLDLSIEPHGTRVLFIHPLADRPQLIGNSRHISGTYSIVSQGWSMAGKELHGESAAMPGKPYTLWFNIPNDYTKLSVEVSSKTGKRMAAVWMQQAGFASLRFTGVEGPVEWRIKFRNHR